jgi:DNA-binding Lrp family transcriptional regulator
VNATQADPTAVLGYYPGMFTAFVLIQTSPDSTAEAAEAIAEIPGVAEVYSVTGEWDLVAMLRFKDFEQLDDIVTLGLRKLSGIKRTQTLLAFRAYSPRLLEQGFNIGYEGS